MRTPMITAAFVAALIGFGGTVAIILAAAAALGATPAETESWLLLLALTTAAGTLIESVRTKIPVLMAWSTPGAALIAASEGYTLREGAGAFLLAAALVVLTGLVPALERWVRAIPHALGAAMLAGVLMPLVLAAPAAVPIRPDLVLPIIAVFLAVRLWQPTYAVLAALIFGVALAVVLDAPGLPTEGLALPVPLPVTPTFDLTALVSLGLPLYLVTMASQNLPGFAVLQSAGYTPPVRSALVTSGALSGVGAVFGGHTVNVAAITAAICLGPDVDPDPARRWRVAYPYAVFWLLLGLAGPLVIATLSAMPPELMATLAGIALLMPLTNALTTAFEAPETRFAATVTLVTGASGLTLFGIGAAFWGLTAGLVILIGERIARADAALPLRQLA